MNARTVPTSPRSRKQATPEGTLVLDLGTSRVRAALLVEGKPRPIEWPELGGWGVPVVVGVDPETGRAVVGDEARRLMLTEAGSMLEAGPRMLGVRAELADVGPTREDPSGGWLGVGVARGRGGDIEVLLGEERWPLPRALGLLLQTLAQRIERRHALTIERTFVTIPPGVDDARRRALLDSLRVAGLANPSLVASTTAAGLAWWTLEREGQGALGILGFEAMLGHELELIAHAPDPELEVEEDDEDSSAAGEPTGDEESPAMALAPPAPAPVVESNVLILDLGAGSFDASLLRCDGTSVEVLGARSRLDVGGLDIDASIIDWLFEQFELTNEIDLAHEPEVRARVRDVAEKAKIALSDGERFEVELPFLWADASGPKHLSCVLERERFERMIRELVEVPAELARELLDDAGLGPDDIDSVVMLGGTSRIPVIQDRIESMFSRVPQTEAAMRDLDEVFTLRGLALEAKRRARRRPEMRVVETASFGVWLRGAGEPTLVIEAGTPLPASGRVSVSIEPGESWSEVFELWQSESPTAFVGQARAWAFAHEFQPALGFRLSGERASVDVHVEIALDGSVGVHIDELVRGKTAKLALERRVGLSGRVKQRLVAEARERALHSAIRDRHDALRRALQELVRTVEGWFADPKLVFEESLRTSLSNFMRDAEAALHEGDWSESSLPGRGYERMREVFDGFDPLVEALPAKLQDGLGGRVDTSLPELVDEPGAELDDEDEELPLVHGNAGLVDESPIE